MPVDLQFPRPNTPQSREERMEVIIFFFFFVDCVCIIKIILPGIILADILLVKRALAVDREKCNTFK